MIMIFLRITSYFGIAVKRDCNFRLFLIEYISTDIEIHKGE